MIEEKNEGKRICGYGEKGKGKKILKYWGIGKDFMGLKVDRNK